MKTTKIQDSHFELEYVAQVWRNALRPPSPRVVRLNPQGQNSLYWIIYRIISLTFKERVLCGSTMDDWKELIGEAMQIETTDTIAAFKIYERAVVAGLTTSQNLLDDVEAAQIIEAIYGALVAYSQTIMLRMKAEDPEIGGVDHAFRAGQAYGVSCVLNHLIDKLTDITGGTELDAMDAFSDTLHDEIIIQGRAAGLTIELLDAKGDILFE